MQCELLRQRVRRNGERRVGTGRRRLTIYRRRQDPLQEGLEASIDPYTREFKQTYIPEDMMPHVPDWAQDRMAVARQLQREKKKLKDNIQELFAEIVRLERRINYLEGPVTVDIPAKPSKLSKPPKPIKPRMQLKYPRGAVVKFVRPFLEQAVP